MHVRREARLTDDHRCGVELSLAPTPVKSSQKNRPDAPYEGLPPNRWMQPTLNAPDRRVGVPPAGDWRPKLGCALAEVRRDRKWVQAVGCHGRCFKHGSRKGRLGHRNLGPSLGHPMAEDRADKLRLGWMPRIDRVVGDLLIRSGGRYPSSPAGRHAATSRRSMVGLVDHDRLDINHVRQTKQLIDGVLGPGESIVAQAIVFRPGKVGELNVTPDYAFCLTEQRALLFEATAGLARNSGRLHSAFPLSDFRSVQTHSRRSWWWAGRRVVQMDAEHAGGVVSVAGASVNARRLERIAGILSLSIRPGSS